MTPIKVQHYDAFSSIPNQGNPAGVVIDADYHATIASLFCLKSKGRLEDKNTIQIETNVGILPITFRCEDEQLIIKMKQDQPRFLPFHGDVAKLAEAMGLVKDDIDLSKPIVYGSTGTWTLIVFIKELDRFKDMKPNNKLFPEVLTQNTRSSIHPVCLDTYDKKAHMHARHFSSPYSGTIEDPVTGTASGVMGAYYLTYMHPELTQFDFIVEQGQEIGRDGRVGVRGARLEDGRMDIHIQGTAVYVQDFEIEEGEV